MRGQLGGYTSGIRRRIKALGLDKNTESAVLSVITGKRSAQAIKMPRKVIKRITQAFGEGLGQVVLTCNGKKWSVYSLNSYLSKTKNLTNVGIARNGHRHNGLDNGHKDVAQRLLAGV